ncbi:DNA-binding transcriptional regulator [Bradyrhizobium sp. LHD-71]|uniref:DNA-binding transcriptional regulator n=1 Tax=Bradyrhizobium sp. LHD-71 TaxID=3072141 RepID=UPI00280E46D7|nr:DNA-binding transcriptional regulator [Bradyrhizobium sp. LHD-71]MDQ8728014.1 DNA-binding transcriptional regulator [Bradyrhizobium sp. LHD-71]
MSLPVESVRRTFALLEELNRQRISSVRHLHEATGLPKSTIVRLLETLRALGYVTNDPRQGGYQVTSGVRSLSAGFHGDPLVVEAARPWAIEFSRQFKLPIGVAVFDQRTMVVRYSTALDSPMSPFHATVNTKLRVLTRAMGRAYVAFCPAEERKYIMDVLAASSHPEDQVARCPDEVREIIARVRRNGFAERSPTVEPKSSNTFSVPILLDGTVLATIGISYFCSSMPKAKAVSSYVPLIMELARKIESSVRALNTNFADGPSHVLENPTASRAGKARATRAAS